MVPPVQPVPRGFQDQWGPLVLPVPPALQVPQALPARLAQLVLSVPRELLVLLVLPDGTAPPPLWRWARFRPGRQARLLRSAM